MGARPHLAERNLTITLSAMTQLPEIEHKFTGLILLTGEDKPGLANTLFQTLSEFAVQIVDVAQLVISDRLILTVLITLNPAHQAAIEADLSACAEQAGVDIATLFSTTEITSHKNGLVAISIESPKLHPKSMVTLTQGILALKANIESIQRTSDSPTSIEITVFGATLDQLSKAVAVMDFADAPTISIVQK